ncbi:MAG: uroporphyrinogen decarboxylase [Planctomycetaceae bacterium]
MTDEGDVLHNSRFLKAARREPVDTTPIWIMRQAGRYLPEYRAVRSQVTFIELCKRPELATEATVSAVNALGVDAAILFADLLPILEPMGMDLEYVTGKGPVIHNPIRTSEAIDALTVLESIDALHFVPDAVKMIRRELPANIPLIGFAGAPFTLASYCIEGGGSKTYQHCKTLMYSDEGAWNTLMSKLSDSVTLYLLEQIKAGCQAVQLFDSWAGCLSRDDYRHYVLPFSKRILDAMPEDFPVIHFVNGNPALLELQREAGGSVMGIDWRSNLGEAWDRFGPDVAVQGNLDPITLFADLDTIKARAKAVLDAAGQRNGHIFNLGHGVLPDMNPDHVKALVEMVHEMGTR